MENELLLYAPEWYRGMPTHDGATKRYLWPGCDNPSNEYVEGMRIAGCLCGNFGAGINVPVSLELKMVDQKLALLSDPLHVAW